MAKTSWVDRILNKLPEAPDNSTYYDVVDTDGQVVQENVKLVLKNPIINSGTPVNANNLNSIEDRLEEAVPKTRTINGKALEEDITITASEIGAASDDDIYALEAQKLDKINSGYGVYSHNGSTQSDIGIDISPTFGSDNLVTSGGTYCAIENNKSYRLVWEQGQSLSSILDDGEYCVKGQLTEYCSSNYCRGISFPLRVYCGQGSCGSFSFQNNYCDNITPAQFSYDGSTYCNPHVTFSPYVNLSTGSNPVHFSFFWMMHPSEGGVTPKLYPGDGGYQLYCAAIYCNNGLPH